MQVIFIIYYAWVIFTNNVQLFWTVSKVFAIYKPGILTLNFNWNPLSITLKRIYVLINGFKHLHLSLKRTKALVEKESHRIYRKMKRKRWKIGEKMYYLIRTRTRLCVYKAKGIGSLLLINKQIEKKPTSRLKGVPFWK